MSAALDALYGGLERCMCRDRRNLRRRLTKLRRRDRDGRPIDRGLEEIGGVIADSQARFGARLMARPSPEFPASLPVSAMRGEIAELIAGHQVVVVCGETGSGKTTQLPKICLELGRGVAGLIAHTQPRRIAARSVAHRIAEELGTPLGREVGFKVRFSDRTSPDSYVKLLTDGLLLAEIQGDPRLEQYDTIIVDEAHERSLNIDFLLGYLKKLLPKRPELKVVITSATIDPTRFSRYFGGAPVVNVSARTYPVALRYCPLASEDPDEGDRDLMEGIVDAVDELAREGPGDVLVFLAGERDIRNVAEALRKKHPPNTEILPLYARLSAADQDRVFKPHNGRRIVLATNVAETSLTVPGIRYVVDPGFARISRYSVHSKIQRLPIEAVSQASANQRKGRCGRLADGICIRLYSEEDFARRPAFTDPEVLRTNLGAVILQMAALGLGEVAEFPFLDPPDPRQIRDGYKLLEELGAVDGSRDITPLGRQIARLPVDPRMGRILLAARERGCVQEAIVIVSALSIQDPRDRPLSSPQAADEKHSRFRDDRSDFLALWNLWIYLEEQSKRLSASQFRKLCRHDFLSFMRIREWRDVERQLRALLKDRGLRPNQEPADYGAIHGALLAGLIGNVGVRAENGAYLGARNRQFHIFPGSALAKKRPQWLLAAELVETTRLYARTVASIDSAWVEEHAAHLVKRSYSNPRWERKSSRVTADLQLTLYGLVVVSGRRVDFGQVDPVAARSIFIREALVAGEFDTSAAFFAHNRELVLDIDALESKARRRDLLVDEETLYEFYSARIPTDVWDGRRFEDWCARWSRDEERRLYLTRDQLMRHSANDISAGRFPDSMQINDIRVPLSYRLEPGRDHDGVTVTLPLAGLNQFEESPFEWLVPGMLEEKMTALIRALPKGIRRNFVPAPEFARVCAESLGVPNGPLTNAMGRELHRVTGVEIPPEAWSAISIPEHLRMRFRIVDGDGQELASGRDLVRLRAQLAGKAEASFGKLQRGEFGRQQLRDWDFGELPESVEIERDGLAVRGYPALVPEHDTVSLTLMDRAGVAERTTRRGIRRLIALRFARHLDGLRRQLPDISAMCLRYAPLGRCDDLKRELLEGAIDSAFLGGDLPRTRAAFERAIAAGEARLDSEASSLCRQAGVALEYYQRIARRLKGSVPPAKIIAFADMASQLEHLVYRGFVLSTPVDRWKRLPVYLRAMESRLDRLDDNPARDRERLLRVEPLWRACLDRLAEEGGREPVDSALETYRWMLEEYRVSLFAQELGTEGRISEKRLARQWATVTSGT